MTERIQFVYDRLGELFLRVNLALIRYTFSDWEEYFKNNFEPLLRHKLFTLEDICFSEGTLYLLMTLEDPDAKADLVKANMLERFPYVEALNILRLYDSFKSKIDAIIDRAPISAARLLSTPNLDILHILTLERELNRT